MAIVRTDDKHYKAIADAIRKETGLTETIYPKDMVNILPLLKNAGWQIGYEYGRQSQYDEFWDAFQDNGAKTSYFYGFYGKGWTDANFKPKYDIKPIGNTNGLFSYAQISNLKQILIDCRVTLDLSKATPVNTTFLGCKQLTYLPIMDFSSTTTLTGIFSGAEALISIDAIVLKSDGSQTFSEVFKNCYALEEVRISGAIGQNGFDVCASPLSHDSLMSIINHLYDYSGTTTTKTLTLGADNLAKLTDAEKAIATERGWSLA